MSGISMRIDSLLRCPRAFRGRTANSFRTPDPFPQSIGPRRSEPLLHASRRLHCRSLLDIADTPGLICERTRLRSSGLLFSGSRIITMTS